MGGGRGRHGEGQGELDPDGGVTFHQCEYVSDLR